MSRPAFEDIPTLYDLIKHSGYPGVQYAIVDIENLMKAQDEGWEELAPATRIFPIRGPKGMASCKLLGRGKPIRGQTLGAISPLHVDVSVKEKTGLGLPDPKPEAKPSK